MRRAAVGLLVPFTLVAAACSGDPEAGAQPEPTPPATSAAATPSASGAPSATPPATATPTPDTEPELEVEVLADDLELPWDVAELASGELLVTEKDSGRIVLFDGTEQRVVSDGPADLWSSGETGFMSLVVDPEDDNRFLTCHGHTAGGQNDVRVVEWTLDEERTSAEEGEPLITGIGSTSGRHGGCRLEISPDGELFVGTGDAAIGENPQDRTNLNGKVLRADPATGEPLDDNPFIDAEDEDERLVYTYGHRNLQGIAFRDDQVFTAEHGPDIDDEVNLLQAGGNYGWNPVPGYDESVPMTDQDLPGEQVEAVWSSGDPTLAISGMSTIEGPEWGSYAGGLAVAALKASQMVFMTLDEDGAVTDTRAPDVLTEHGRLRSVTQAADGSLLVTTSNGSGDELLRVTPAG